MRSLWKGTLAVGRVPIPIALYKSAEHVDDVSLRTLHEPCGTPVTMERRCPTCDCKIGPGETVNGFEFAEGQFVTISGDEIKAAIAGDRVALDRFIPVDLIGAAMLDTTYWLAPSSDPAAAHAYDALLQALEKTGLAGIGRIGMSQRERTVAVWPIAVDGVGTIIGLSTLYAVDGIRVEDAQTIHSRIAGLGPLAATKPEVDLFAELLNKQRVAESFRWRAIKRVYPSKLLELVEAKRAGGEITVAPQVADVAPLDLMDALKKSIARRKPRETAKR